MLKQFAQKIGDFKRLIGDSQSASFRHPEQGDGGSVRFLLAVSGGMDSMCMLDLFSHVVPVTDFAVAHCNFSLRGAESDGDQELVESRARELGVRVFVKRFDTEDFAGERGVSIEMAARELRYSWFAELCQEHEFAAVVVAHNANDNAETLLLNLLRGTGLNGLHGMLEVQWRADCRLHCPPLPGRGWQNANSDNQSVLPTAQLTIFRPMLEMTRKQIEGYVMARKVAYRDDHTNFESEYKRNRIRNEVFPVFEKVNPSFVKILNREIGYFAEAGSIVEDWCRAQLPKVIDGYHSEEREQLNVAADTITISLPALLATEHWRYLLYYILQPYGFNSATLESLESLLASDRTLSGKRFESSSHILYTERNSLVVRPASKNEILDRYMVGTGIASSRREWLCAAQTGASGDHCLSDIVVRGEGVYNLNGVRWQVKLVEKTPEFNLKQPVGTVIMDADKMAFPFVCRPWRQGDWFVPFGLKGRKKVSDLFVDLKFTQIDKERALMMVDCRGDLAENQHIAGVLGRRIDDRYKVDQNTKNIILMTILNNTDTI